MESPAQWRLCFRRTIPMDCENRDSIVRDITVPPDRSFHYPLIPCCYHHTTFSCHWRLCSRKWVFRAVCPRGICLYLGCGSHSAFELSDKLVDDFLLDMLHHYHMGEVAAESSVVAVGRILFLHYIIGGTLKTHRVAVFVIPVSPSYTGEFRHEVGCILHYCRSLFCPAFYAYGPQQPPEFQRLDSRTRAVYHAHNTRMHRSTSSYCLMSWNVYG